MIRLTAAFRGAGRQALRHPGPSIFIALTMAIGIAASAAIFAVARGVVLRPLPYRDPESLVVVREFRQARPAEPGGVAFNNLSWLQDAASLTALTAFSYSEFVVSGDADAERFIGANVDAALFTTLGVTPLYGRGFSAGEVGEGAARLVVLDYDLWTRRYGGDRALVGQSIVIDDAPHTVIGVMPPSFEFPRSPSMNRDVRLWVPRRPPSPMMARRGTRDLTVVARLAAGSRIEQAQSELAALSQRAEGGSAGFNAGWSVRVVPLREAVVGRVRPTITMLSVCVAVLLIIAAANASAAVLARVTMRRQVFGVRIALGADRRRLVELVMAESLLLAGAAMVMALPLSTAIRVFLIQVAPVAVPRQSGIGLDATTLVFTAAVSLAAAAGAALGPLSWLRRLDVRSLLNEGDRGSSGSRRRTRAVSAFVIGQVAFGTVLIATTLGAYSLFTRYNRVDPGFAMRDVITATIPLRGMRYRDPQARAAVTGQLLDRVRALPGVDRAAVASLMPLAGGLMSSSYQVVGLDSDSTATAAMRAVSSDFFETLEIPIRKGRGIERNDDANSAPVVVVNEALVRRSVGTRDPLGSEISVIPPGSNAPVSFRVVGVAGDARELDLLGPPTPIIYFSDQQASYPHTVIAVRFTGASPVNGLRTALRDLDPGLALDDVSDIATKVRSTYALQYFLLNILASFAGGAILLIVVGIYGSMSFVVNADIRSIGVRLALGATRTQIVSALLRRMVLLGLLGCTLGIAVTVLLARLPGLADAPLDPAIVFSTAAAALVMALGATLAPAWRAGNVAPLTALAR